MPQAAASSSSEPLPEPFAPIRPAQIRYIKLGAGGRWEAQALAEGRLYFSNNADPLQEAAADDWAAVEQHYRRVITSRASATTALRDLREFFTLGPDTLWITFAQGKMWWAFSETAQLVEGTVGQGEAAAYRNTLAPWSCCDRFGRSLSQAGLSTKLTKLAAYRRSICKVAHGDYALRRINGEEGAPVVLLRERKASLIAAAAEVVRALHWRDFELLVDLIFASAGWRRISELGGTMKDIDLLLEQPVTGERISVQVKSSIDQKTANRCIADFEQGGDADRFFLVYHSGKPALRSVGTRPVHLWSAAELAARAVDAGLTDWLASRAG